MAQSEVEICNAALSRIGHTELLEEVGGGSLEETEDGTTNVPREQCALWYPRVRDMVLRAYPWPFATTRYTLPRLTDTRSDWDFVFQHPGADCLALREVLLPGIRNPRPDQRPAHRIEARRDAEGTVIGKVILSDQEELEARVTWRITDVGRFDPDFEQALVSRLAHHLAPAIVKGDEGRRLNRECLEEYATFVRVAAAAAFNEEQPDQEPDGELLASRSA